MGPGNYPPPLLRPSQLLTCGHSFKGGSHSTWQLPIHPDTSASSSPGERSGGVPWQLLLPVSHVFPMLSVAGILSWFQGKGHAVQANLWGSPSPHPDSRQPQSSTQRQPGILVVGVRQKQMALPGKELLATAQPFPGTGGWNGDSTAGCSSGYIQGKGRGEGATSSGRQSGDWGPLQHMTHAVLTPFPA